MPSIKFAKFLKSASRPEDLPREPWPHCCFAGRSNAGKSSMINALLGRKGLARTGKTPGLTRQINFFSLNDGVFFADLPGYGYSSGPRDETLAWRGLIETYLRDTANRKLIFLLVDARRGANADDAALHEWLGFFGLPVRVVAAKMDLVPQSREAAALKNIAGALGLEEEPLPFSTREKRRAPAVWKAMDQWLG